MTSPSTDELTPSWHSYVRTDMIAALLTVMFFALWSYQTTGKLSLREIGILTAMVAAVTIWGRVLASSFRLSAAIDLSYPFVFLLGMTFLAAVVSMGRLFLPFDISILFWSLFGAGCLLLVGIRKQLCREQARSAAGVIGLLATFLSLAAATSWVQHYFPPTVGTDERIIFKPIRDNFIHTQQVILLAYPGNLQELGRYGLAGEPIPFYHYASYVFPALLTWTGPQTAYDATIALWLPLGLAVVGLSAFVLGTTLFGPRSGLWCVVAVIVLPDPTYWTFGIWPLGVSIYSFLRFLQIATANAYGIAVAAMGLTCIVGGLRASKPSCVVLGLGLAGASLIFKAQVFMAAFPLCFLVATLGALVQWRAEIKRTIVAYPAMVALVVLALGVGAGGVFFSPLWERTPTIQLEFPPGKRLAEYLVTRTMDDPPADAIARLAVTSRGNGTILLRAALVLFVTFRFGLILMSFVALGALALLKPQWMNGIPVLATMIYLSYALLLAPNITGHPFGNPWDLQFVPFCWVYFLVVVWTIGLGRELLRQLLSTRRKVPIVIAIVLLLLPFQIGRRDTDDWLTGQLWAYLPVPRGLVESAEYLRSQTKSFERFQDGENDPYYLVEALAERRAYAGWPVVGSYTARDRGDQVFQARIKEHERMKQATTSTALVEFVKATGIQWYVLHPESEVAWPSSVVDHPDFTSGGYRVYNLGKLLRN